MTTLTTSQLADALAYAKGLEQIIKGLPEEPEWGAGLHLNLPNVIPLTSDYRGDDHVYAWLVANDFEGYDVTTTDPTPSDMSSETYSGDAS